jgi:hypothetical protein
MLWRFRGVTTLTGGFGGLLSFAKSRSDDKVAPIPDIQSRALTKKGCIGWARRALRDIIFVQLHAAVDDHFEEHRLARR